MPPVCGLTTLHGPESYVQEGVAETLSWFFRAHSCVRQANSPCASTACRSCIGTMPSSWRVEVDLLTRSLSFSTTTC